MRGKVISYDSYLLMLPYRGYWPQVHEVRYTPTEDERGKPPSIGFLDGIWARYLPFRQVPKDAPRAELPWRHFGAPEGSPTLLRQVPLRDILALEDAFFTVMGLSYYEKHATVQLQVVRLILDAGGEVLAEYLCAVPLGSTPRLEDIHFGFPLVPIREPRNGSIQFLDDDFMLPHLPAPLSEMRRRRTPEVVEAFPPPPAKAVPPGHLAADHEQLEARTGPARLFKDGKIQVTGQQWYDRKEALAQIKDLLESTAAARKLEPKVDVQKDPNDPTLFHFKAEVPTILSPEVQAKVARVTETVAEALRGFVGVAEGTNSISAREAAILNLCAQGARREEVEDYVGDAEFTDPEHTAVRYLLKLKEPVSRLTGTFGVTACGERRRAASAAERRHYWNAPGAMPAGESFMPCYSACPMEGVGGTHSDSWPEQSCQWCGEAPGNAEVEPLQLGPTLRVPRELCSCTVDGLHSAFWPKESCCAWCGEAPDGAPPTAVRGLGTVKPNAKYSHLATQLFDAAAHYAPGRRLYLVDEPDAPFLTTDCTQHGLRDLGWVRRAPTPKMPFLVFHVGLNPDWGALEWLCKQLDVKPGVFERRGPISG